MKIKSLFDNVGEISITSYLKKCGVEDVDEYLSGQIVEPYTNYDNIEECADEVIEWLKDNDTIHQICDCDFDGSASSSMLHCYLKLINPNLNIITHFHSDKSHGLSKEILNQLNECEPSLLIIADASTNDTSECKNLSNLGWKVQIYDHHQKEKSNPYAKIVNNQMSDEITNKGLCGTGVAFKVIQAIDNQLDTKYSKEFISYVWLANVSDSVPFTHPEQYTFAKWGRKYIHKNVQPFIDEWCEGKLDNKTIAWKLTPKFNSAVRLGTLEDKQELFSALCGEIDPSNIIDKCKKYHTQQQAQSKQMVEEVEIINDSSVVIGRLHEKTTMTGLIAGKLMSKYGKPILLVHESNGQISGSVRSPIPIKSIFNDSELFSMAQGHDHAMGVSYPLSNEQAIIDYLDSVLSSCEPCRDVLISLPIKNIPSSLFSFAEDYRHIFGKGLDVYYCHIQPFTIYNTDIKVLGKGGTIKFTKDGIDFISFFTSNDMKERLYMNVDDKVKLEIELICELGWNIWNGRKSKQAIIQDFECSKVDEEEIKWEEIW